LEAFQNPQKTNYGEKSNSSQITIFHVLLNYRSYGIGKTKNSEVKLDQGCPDLVTSEAN
jgi:hypothetical protein